MICFEMNGSRYLILDKTTEIKKQFPAKIRILVNIKLVV